MLDLLMEWPQLERTVMWNCGLPYDIDKAHTCPTCRARSSHVAPVYAAMVWR